MRSRAAGFDCGITSTADIPASLTLDRPVCLCYKRSLLRSRGGIGESSTSCWESATMGTEPVEAISRGYEGDVARHPKWVATRTLRQLEDRRRFTMCAVALAPPRLSQTTHPEGDDRAAARSLERRLLIRYHRDGDLAARDELVERFLPLARDLALRYTYTDEPFDDLLQVASLGLIKAIDRFEPGRGTKFTSYAAPTILGELKRHFRDKGWALHVPRDLQERTLAVSRESE